MLTHSLRTAARPMVRTMSAHQPILATATVTNTTMPMALNRQLFYNQIQNDQSQQFRQFSSEKPSEPKAGESTNETEKHGDHYVPGTGDFEKRPPPELGAMPLAVFGGVLFGMVCGGCAICYGFKAPGAIGG